LVIDGLATRYSLLPSEVIQRADVFDMYVMDTALNWEQYCQREAEAKHKGVPVTPDLSQDQLLKMMERVKNEV